MRLDLTTNQTGYYPQLDGLRAVAIVLVILFHWFPDVAVIETLATGPLGVTLFFVLSGFLITLILLKGRNYLSQVSFSDIYANFMIRRILRIFPVYYFVLFFVWANQYLPSLPDINTRFFEYPAYYLAYGSNFLISKYADWSDLLSIYWTLAVEEQFYLFWPFVILLTPTKYLKFAIVTCIGLGIISRVVLWFAGDGSGVLMPTCMDSFGFGAIWGLVLFKGDNPGDFVQKLGKFALAGLLVYFVLCFVDNSLSIKTLLFRTSMSVVCLYLVVMATYNGGFKSLPGLFFNSRSIRFLGKTSYGMYIYHMLVPQFLMPCLIKIASRIFNVEIVLSPGPFRILSLFLLSVVSIISWYSLELPFRYLKSEFQLTSGQIRD